MFYGAGSNLQWNLGECSGDDRNYGKSFASIIVIISWMDGETAYNARDMSLCYEKQRYMSHIYYTNLRYVETRHMGPYYTIWRKTNVLEKHTAPILQTCFDFDAIRYYTITMKGTYRYSTQSYAVRG